MLGCEKFTKPPVRNSATTWPLSTCGVVRGRRTTYLVVSVALSFIIYCRLLPSVISCFRLAAGPACGEREAETKLYQAATLPSYLPPSPVWRKTLKGKTKIFPTGSAISTPQLPFVQIAQLDRRVTKPMTDGIAYLALQSCSWVFSPSSVF